MSVKCDVKGCKQKVRYAAYKSRWFDGGRPHNLCGPHQVLVQKYGPEGTRFEELILRDNGGKQPDGKAERSHGLSEVQDERGSNC